MTIQAAWLNKGYIDVSEEDPRHTTTQDIRAALCRGLGLTPRALTIKGWPVGPAWRNTVWWRESEDGYREAQYFLQILRDCPMLSLGLSIEKGLGTMAWGAAHYMPDDDPSWDWRRLVHLATPLVDAHIPAAASSLGRPVTLRFRVHHNHNEQRETTIFHDESRAYTFASGEWFARNVGHASVADVVGHIRHLDGRRERWVDASITVDLGAEAADGMTADAVAALLLHFEPVRQRLRGR